MAIVVKIEGTAIDAGKIAKNACSIKEQSNKKHNLSIALYYTENDTPPVPGQDIEVYEDTTLKFGGILKTGAPVPITPHQGADAELKISFTSDGYNFVAQRRTVNVYYTETTSGAIVEEMVDNFLVDEGVTKGTISTGATIDFYNARRLSIKEVLDAMAAASGYTWDINDAKELNFIAPTTVTTSTRGLTSDDGDHFNFRPKYNLGQFRNKQFVEGGVDSTGTVVVAEVENTADITARAAAEGNSGVYGNVYRDTNIQNTTDAEAVATELLNRYGKPQSFTVSSYTAFEVGKIMNVTYAKYGIATDSKYLVTSMTSRREESRWVYSITAEARDTTDYSAKVKDNAVDFFSKLTKNREQPEEGAPTYNITQVDNEAAYSAISETTLAGIDVDFKVDTQLIYNARFKVTPSVGMSLIVKIRVGGVAIHTTTVDLSSGNADTVNINGEIEGIVAGTKTVDVTILPSTGTANIAIGDYQLYTFVKDTVSEAAFEGRITIDHTKIDSDLTDYPIMVKIDSGTRLTFPSDGTKIHFVAADGTTELKFEREYYSQSEKLGVFHVKVPSVSSSVDTTIYLKLDASTDKEDASNVWDSNYIMVQHMGTSLEDSTANNNDGVNNGTAVVDGLNGKARQFDGINDYININSIVNDLIVNGNVTLQSVSKFSVIGSQVNIVDICDEQARKGFRLVYFSGTQNFQLQGAGTRYSVLSSAIITTDQHYLMSGRYDGTNKDIDVGTINDTNVGGSWEIPVVSYIGCQRAASGALASFFEGVMDEVRVSKINRSDAWIKADDYNLIQTNLISIV